MNFMEFGEYDNVGVSIRPDIRQRIEEVMDCLFPCKAYTVAPKHCYDDFSPDQMRSAEDMFFDHTDLFYLLNTLFGGIRVYYELGEYDSVSGYYRHAEGICDPESQKIRCAYYDYCEEDRTIKNIPVFHYIDRKELQEKLNQARLSEPLRTEMIASGLVPDHKEYDEAALLMAALFECSDLRSGWNPEIARAYLKEYLSNAAAVNQIIDILDEIESNINLKTAATELWSRDIFDNSRNDRNRDSETDDDDLLKFAAIFDSIHIVDDIQPVDELRNAAQKQGYDELLALIQEKFG